MARVLPKKHPFAATDVVAAWQAFAWDDPEDGRPYTIATTLRLRGDHPAVVAQPWRFAKADAPAESKPTMWDHMAEPIQPEPEFHRPAPPVAQEDAVVAQVDLLMTQTGRSIRKGQRFHRDDPLVKSNPELFAVVTPLVKELS